MLLQFTTSAFAATGITGRAAWRGDVVAGLVVRAYSDIADIPADKAVAVSSPTAADGTFSLELPPGSYYLTVRSPGVRLAPGDYFAYFSGAPVRVDEGRLSTVAFNLIRIPQEATAQKADYTAIKGEILFQGAPLERVYLYVYQDPGEGFKGPGYLIQPVEKGHFQLRLPPGDYWLVARKRAKGGRYGPIEPGDYFSYYHGNPVHVEAGTLREVRIETITRMVPEEEGATQAFRGIAGKILGPDGRPVVGVHVFGYRDAEMTGAPVVFSASTGSDGRFQLSLPEAGNWYLLARQSFGGPTEAGELFGRYGGSVATPVMFKSDDAVREVTIHVERKANP